MIAVDTSALVALARGEPEQERFNDLIANQRIVIGAPTVLEAGMVLPGMVTRSVAEKFLTGFLSGSDAETIPFSMELMFVARDAFYRFGKGRHPAKLNFGDCMSYAVAKVRDVPLLYKGDDFAQTDLRSAWRP